MGWADAGGGKGRLIFLSPLRMRGLSVLEIAIALGVSERTVFRYLMAANA